MNPGMMVGPVTYTQVPLDNVYSDIYNTFLLINEALSSPGSCRSKSRKMSDMSDYNKMIIKANQLARVAYVPVSANHSSGWLMDSGSLESEKISMISYQLQYYIDNVGN